MSPPTDWRQRRRQVFGHPAAAAHGGPALLLRGGQGDAEPVRVRVCFFCVCVFFFFGVSANRTRRTTHAAHEFQSIDPTARPHTYEERDQLTLQHTLPHAHARESISQSINPIARRAHTHSPTPMRP